MPPVYHHARYRLATQEMFTDLVNCRMNKLKKTQGQREVLYRSTFICWEERASWKRQIKNVKEKG